MTLSYEDSLKLIREYGLEPYQNCPCGSQKKYKFCCYSKRITFNSEKSISEQVIKMNEIFNRRKWELKKCIVDGCNKKSQLCHSIQNNRFLNQICDKNKKVYHIHQIFFKYKTGINVKIQVDFEPVDIASTFNLLCNHHDSKIFEVIEKNNDIIFSAKQIYALTYRAMLYMLAKKNVMNQFIIPQFLASNWKMLSNKFEPKNQEEADIAVDNLLYLHKHEKSSEDLFEAINEIGANYDNSLEVWQIKRENLLFSQIRILHVKKVDFCFHTSREYLFKNSERYPGQFFELLNEKRHNYITTIVLPNKEDNTFFVLFSVCKQNKFDMSFFIDMINNSTDEEIINLLNNIILNAYEELYFSKEKFDLDEQQDLINYIQTNMNEDDYLLYDDLFAKAKFKFIQ